MGERVYRCTMCTCIFKKVASLNGHITKAHSNGSKESDEITKVMEQLSNLEKRATGNVDSSKSDDAQQIKENIAKDETETDTSFVKLADSSVDGVVKRYVVKQARQGDVRVYVCSYCDKQFKKPSDLIRHIRVHTREKPFKVHQSSCNYVFIIIFIFSASNVISRFH